ALPSTRQSVSRNAALAETNPDPSLRVQWSSAPTLRPPPPGKAAPARETAPAAGTVRRFLVMVALIVAVFFAGGYASLLFEMPFAGDSPTRAANQVAQPAEEPAGLREQIRQLDKLVQSKDELNAELKKNAQLGAKALEKTSAELDRTRGKILELEEQI